MNSLNERIIIFERLRQRLRAGVPEDVLERALVDNEWFTREDIVYAIEAIEWSMVNGQWSMDKTLNTKPELDVAIIMAGNIPAVGFADLAYVLLAGHRAHIKPSHKDAALINWIVSLLPEMPIYQYEQARHYDAVIATGGEQANLYFRTKFAGVPSILRSSRSSAAVITGTETETELRGLGDDIFRYSGLGCRSVSLLLVPQNTDIELLAKQIAPKKVHPKYSQNYRYNRASLIAQIVHFTDAENFVMVENSSFPTAISQINYIKYRTFDEVERWLAAHERELQCVIGRNIPFERTADFGCAQRPTLTDFADGIDIFQWLMVNG